MSKAAQRAAKRNAPHVTSTDTATTESTNDVHTDDAASSTAGTANVGAGDTGDSAVASTQALDVSAPHDAPLTTESDNDNDTGTATDTGVPDVDAMAGETAVTAAGWQHVDTSVDHAGGSDAISAHVMADASTLATEQAVALANTPMLVTLTFDATRSQAYDVAQLVANAIGANATYQFANDGEFVVLSPLVKSPAKRAPLAMTTSHETPVFLANAGPLSRIALQPVKVVTIPSAQQQALIDLCVRDDGATTADLYTTTRSTTGVPWRDLVANAAKRFGYVMGSHTDSMRRVHYTLRKPESC